MMTILVPIDGSGPSDNAVRRVIDLRAGGLGANVMLLSDAGEMKRARPAMAYPAHLEETVGIGNARVLLRPIRPDDAHAYARFISRTDPSDIRLRFFRDKTSALTPEDLAHQTHVDYDRDIAFVAIELSGSNAGEIAGEVRAFRYPDSTTAEVSALVRSDMQKRGLGRALLEKMIEYGRATGVHELIGQMLPDNQAMIALARRCGMEAEHVESAGIVVTHIDLRLKETDISREPDDE